MPMHRFIGDRETPAALNRIRARRPSLGTGKMPEALSAMARSRTIYTAAEATQKPSVDVEPVNDGGRHLWRVRVPVTGDLRGHRPGLSLERHPSDKYLAEVKTDV